MKGSALERSEIKANVRIVAQLKCMHTFSTLCAYKKGRFSAAKMLDLCVPDTQKYLVFLQR